MKNKVKDYLPHVEIIRKAMIEKGWNAAKLSRVSGVSTGVLSRYFKNDGISADNLYAVLKALGLDAPVRRQEPIPVISWIKAGYFADSSDNWPVGISGEADPVFSYRKVGPYAFALRVEGDSMAPRYLSGDIIIVDPELRCDNGTPCVVSLNGEVSFKLFYETETEIRLQPINDRYPETIIKKGSQVDFKVIGKVVDMIPKI